MNYIGRYRVNHLRGLLEELSEGLDYVMTNTLRNTAPAVNPTLKEAQEILNTAREFYDSTPEYKTKIKSTGTSFTWKMPSFDTNSKNEYTVTLSPGFTCTCMYFRLQTKCCKHIFVMIEHHLDNFITTRTLDIYELLKHAASILNFNFIRPNSNSIFPLYLSSITNFKSLKQINSKVHEQESNENDDIQQNENIDSENEVLGPRQLISIGARRKEKRGRPKKRKVLPEQTDFDIMESNDIHARVQALTDTVVSVKLRYTPIGERIVTTLLGETEKYPLYERSLVFQNKQNKDITPTEKQIEDFLEDVETFLQNIEPTQKNGRKTTNTIGFRFGKTKKLQRLCANTEEWITKTSYNSIDSCYECLHIIQRQVQISSLFPANKGFSHEAKIEKKEIEELNNENTSTIEEEEDENDDTFTINEIITISSDEENSITSDDDVNLEELAHLSLDDVLNYQTRSKRRRIIENESELE